MIRSRPFTVLLLLAMIAILSACSTTGHKPGGYYKDDGPDDNPPANARYIPDAVPRIETHNPANSRPYLVFGVRYVPVDETVELQQKGLASWYGKKFQGNKTASGETYDMYAMTAAHPTLPLPSYATVTRVATGKSVVVRINDRGPFHSKRIIDLSYAAAAKLGIIKHGSASVVVQAITNDDIRENQAQTIKASPEPQPTMITRSPPESATPQPTHASPADQPADDAIAALASSLPAPAAQATQQNVTDADDIYLQFGAFGAAVNADHLASSLNQYIGTIERRRALVASANNLHRVQIGPYPSRTAAVNAALRIKQATGLQPLIATR